MLLSVPFVLHAGEWPNCLVLLCNTNPRLARVSLFLVTARKIQGRAEREGDDRQCLRIILKEIRLNMCSLVPVTFERYIRMLQALANTYSIESRWVVTAPHEEARDLLPSN